MVTITIKLIKLIQFLEKNQIIQNQNNTEWGYDLLFLRKK